MTYQSLYRKYRPKKFSELVGQNVLTEVLQKSIIKKQIAHAYLFSGPRGTGKTSMAKLFAQGINCEMQNGEVCNQCSNCQAGFDGNHPDIIEMDAASNNGVEDIRNLIERVKYTPIMGSYKVYIIDEVHMLSQGAFNALLKTLEEPPSHVVFILATTELHKVIPTIVSRCQHFDFQHINQEAIIQRLEDVLEKESIKYDQGVLEAVAKLSGGGLRNALTIIEKSWVISDEFITIDNVYQVSGMISHEDKIKLFNELNIFELEGFQGEVRNLIARVNQPEQISLSIASSIKDSLIYSLTQNKKYIPYDDVDFVLYLSDNFTKEKRKDFLDLIMSYINKMKMSQNATTYFEIMMLDLYYLNQGKNEKRKFKEANYQADYQEENQNVSRETFPSVEKNSGYENEEAKINLNIQDADSQRRSDEISRNSVTQSSRPQLNLVVKDEGSRKTNPELIIEEQDLLTAQSIISYMVAGDKAMRIKDEEKIEGFEIHKSPLKWARSYRLLSEGQLVLSSQDFLVFAFKEESIAKETQVKAINKELISFMEFLTDAKRRIFAILATEFEAGVKKFVNLSQEGELPEAIQFEDSDLSDDDDDLEKMQELFGDKLEVIT